MKTNVHIQMKDGKRVDLVVEKDGMFSYNEVMDLVKEHHPVNPNKIVRMMLTYTEE